MHMVKSGEFGKIKQTWWIKNSQWQKCYNWTRSIRKTDDCLLHSLSCTVHCVYHAKWTQKILLLSGQLCHSQSRN